MEVKICRHCGQEFRRPAKCSDWKWERRTFCGLSCLHAYNASHQSPNAQGARLQANEPVNERSPGDISHRCRHCGRRFWGKRGQIYCSAGCEDRATRIVAAMQYFLELMQA